MNYIIIYPILQGMPCIVWYNKGKGVTDAMGFGIAIMGLNGAGKTTLGKCLERISDFKRLDVETYYFPNPDEGYALSRSGEEVEKLLLEDMDKYPFFAVSSVRLDFSDEIRDKIGLAVCLTAPKVERMKRIRTRAFEKFSSRVLPGGDMFEREEAFFSLAEKRSEAIVFEALDALSCPKIFLSGTDAPEENARRILDEAAKIYT